MPSQREMPRAAMWAYVAPFAAFFVLMSVERMANLPASWLYPLRFCAVLAMILLFSRGALAPRPSAPWGSVAMGIAVFAIWIAPDLLFGPGYRQLPIFENSVTGHAASSAPAALNHNVAFLIVRTLGCTALVPVMEELFWRGWLMRWLIENDFRAVKIGTYAPFAFWTVALLFASEHGPYWEVGLIAGVAYNWWCIRTKTLADCILAHAVTNGLLSAYVLYAGQWQYWL
jgi:CAAX prenyl protease-like protein